MQPHKIIAELCVIDRLTKPLKAMNAQMDDLSKPIKGVEESLKKTLAPAKSLTDIIGKARENAKNLGLATHSLPGFPAQTFTNKVPGMGLEKTVVDLTRVLASLPQILAGAAVTGLVYNITKKGMDSEAEANRLEALSKATPEEMERLKKRSLVLGSQTQFSQLDVLQGMKSLASGGFNVAEISSMIDPTVYLTGAAKLKEPMLAMADSSEILAGTMNAFHLSAKDAGHTADTLAYLLANSSTTLSNFSYAIAEAGSAAHSYGLSFEDTSAVLRAMIQNKVAPSVAGNAITSFLPRILKPTSDALKTMAKYGMNQKSFAQFADKKGHIKDIFGLFEFIHKKDIATQDMVSIFGDTAGNRMMGIFQLFAEMRAFSDSLKSQKNTAENLSQNEMRSLGGKFDSLGANIETIGQKIYTGSIEGPLKSLVDTTNRILDALLSFADTMPSTFSGLADIALLLASFLPFGGILGKLLGPLVKNSRIFQAVGSVTSRITESTALGHAGKSIVSGIWENRRSLTSVLVPAYIVSKIISDNKSPEEKKEKIDLNITFDNPPAPMRANVSKLNSIFNITLNRHHNFVTP